MIYENFEKKLNQVMDRNKKYYRDNNLHLSITNEGEDVYFGNGQWIIHFNSLNGFTTVDEYAIIVDILIKTHSLYKPKVIENLQNISTGLFRIINLNIQNQVQITTSVRDFKKLMLNHRVDGEVVFETTDNNGKSHIIHFKYRNFKDFLDLFNVSLDSVLAITFVDRIASVILLDRDRPFDFGFILLEDNHSPKIEYKI